ncbi:MAG: GNAT family N-acetyltransferase [Bacteriovoracia bacterium]
MLNLRIAQLSDAKNIFELRNNPEIRKMSFDSDRILYESHLSWFRASLENPQRLICALELEHVLVGIVRYDELKPSTVEVSIFIDPKFWGQGLGNEALVKSETLMREKFISTKEIRAQILADNHGSIRLFEKAGYKLKSHTFEKEVV